MSDAEKFSPADASTMRRKRDRYKVAVSVTVLIALGGILAVLCCGGLAYFGLGTMGE